MIPMIQRIHYLNKLISYKDTEFIKVITGVRRSGKSFILELFYQHLLSLGISTNAIVKINFEHPDFFAFHTINTLNEYIKNNVNHSTKLYFLFDEIQEVQEWQKLINGLRVAYDCDIYVTGSNANLLSGELATYLSGRYVEINVFPLSFAEFLSFKSYTDETKMQIYFNEYLKFGGFPSIALLNNEYIVNDVLKGTYDSIILKDVSLRGNIKDPELLLRVVYIVMENIGQPISSNKIANYISSSGRSVKQDTIEKHLQLLENSFIIYKANRYDIRGKEKLKTLSKYYAVDTGIRNSLLNRLNINLGSQIENIVYLHLIRSGFQVFVGKYDTAEIDFVCFNVEQVLYIQVVYELPKSKEREFDSLLKIPNNYRRILVTNNANDVGTFEGIPIIHLLDFLKQTF